MLTDKIYVEIPREQVSVMNGRGAKVIPVSDRPGVILYPSIDDILNLRLIELGMLELEPEDALDLVVLHRDGAGVELE